MKQSPMISSYVSVYLHADQYLNESSLIAFESIAKWQITNEPLLYYYVQISYLLCVSTQGKWPHCSVLGKHHYFMIAFPLLNVFISPQVEYKDRTFSQETTVRAP